MALHKQLVEACEKGDLNEVKWFINHEQVDPNEARNEKGETPLTLAVWYNHQTIVRYLIEQAGANVNIAESGGYTALYLACEKGYTDLIRYLVEEAGANVNKQKYTGATPLFVACQLGHLHVVQYLLQRGGADINMACNDGKTPLYIASEKGRGSVVNYLLECEGVDTEPHTRDGSTPLWIAAQNGHFLIIQRLVEKGNDPNHRNFNGRTPLHVSCRQGHLHVARLLLRAGASLGSVDNGGFTPLCDAAAWGRTSVVQHLLQAGADPTICGWNGNTCLHLAAWKGRTQVVKVLVRQGRVNLNALDYYGYTPLQLAVLANTTDCIEVLLQAGARLEEMPRKASAEEFVEDACQINEKISLRNVLFIRVDTLVEAGRIPHYDQCQGQGWHVEATDVDLNASDILFVSHRWGSPTLPDPKGTQYSILMDFLQTKGPSVEYLWIDYSCICQDHESELFAAQLANTVTAIWCCTRCIIIPQVIQAVCINTSQRTSVTYLKDYVERAWCSFEAMAALLSGTEVYCSFQIGSAMAHQKFDRPEGAASGLGFYTSNVNAYNYFMHNRSRDFKKVNKDTLDSLWDAVEPCKMLSLIVGIARKGRGEYSEILEKSQSLAVQLCDAGHKGRSELRELWDRMGQCTVDDDKLVVFNMMLFIGFYRMRVWEQRKEELCQGCTGDGMICAPGEGCSVM